MVDDELVFRLPQLLQEDLNACKGNHRELVAAINRANPTERRVDERKIKQILALLAPKGPKPAASKTKRSLQFRLDDLFAIHAYRKKVHGRGLDDEILFRYGGERPVLDWFLPATDAEVTFYLANRARSDEKRDYVSAWDVRTLRELINSANEIRPSPSLQVEMVAVRHVNDSSSLLQLVETVPTVCCIGSPRASPLAEVMLERMFEGAGTSLESQQSSQNVPFRFAWPAGKKVHAKGPFALDKTELATWGFKQSANKNRFMGGFVFRDKSYHARDTSPKRTSQIIKDYAIIAVQRRNTNQVWMVLAGLSGPGTYAAGEILRKLRCSVPETAVGNPSGTVYWAVEVAVELDNKQTDGDHRRVTDAKLLAGPCYWPEALPVP